MMTLYFYDHTKDLPGDQYLLNASKNKVAIFIVVISVDLSPPSLVEDLVRFDRSGEFVRWNEKKPNIWLVS